MLYGVAVDEAHELAVIYLQLTRSDGPSAFRCFQCADYRFSFGLVHGFNACRSWGRHIVMVGEDGGGQRFEVDNLSIGHNVGLLDNVSKLTDVAGPVVFEQYLFGLLGKGFDGFLIKGGVLTDEMFGEGYNVLFSLPQRGNGKLHNIKAEIEVGTEGSLSDHLFKVPVGSANHADVNMMRLGRTDGGHAGFLDYPQELALQFGVEFADFVKEDSSAVRGTEKTYGVCSCAGKSALFVSEKLALEKLAC